MVSTLVGKAAEYYRPGNMWNNVYSLLEPPRLALEFVENEADMFFARDGTVQTAGHAEWKKFTFLRAGATGWGD